MLNTIFSVRSSGQTGQALAEALKKAGVNVAEWPERVMTRRAFTVTNGVVHDCVGIEESEIPTKHKGSIGDIIKYVESMGHKQVAAEAAPLAWLQVANGSLGRPRVVFFHEPIKTSDVADPALLALYDHSADGPGSLGIVRVADFAPKPDDLYVFAE